MFGDAGFQGFGQDASGRVFVGLDAVADDGPDGIDMGVHQQHRRAHALFRVVHHPAQRCSQAGNERILIGGSQTFQVVGAEIQSLGSGGGIALGPDVGLGLVHLGDFVLQPLAELGRHGGQSLLGLGDGLGIDGTKAAPDLHAKGIGRADDLGRIAHGGAPDDNAASVACAG